MEVIEVIQRKVEESVGKVFGHGEERKINVKLMRNVGLFGGAIWAFKNYGYLFDV